MPVRLFYTFPGNHFSGQANLIIMGLFYIPLDFSTGILFNLLALAALILLPKQIPWQKLQQPTVFSAWCASVIVLVLVWRMRVPVHPDLHLHLMGVALLALMFDRTLAMWGASVAVFAYTAEYDGSWLNLGANILLLAIIPCSLSAFILRKSREYLPHHMFIYLFGNGFFGAFAVNASAGMLALLMHGWLLPGKVIPADAFAYMLLLTWGEAFLNGFLVTIFAVYRPQWLFTFDDRVYLKEK